MNILLCIENNLKTLGIPISDLKTKKKQQDLLESVLHRKRSVECDFRFKTQTLLSVINLFSEEAHKNYKSNYKHCYYGSVYVLDTEELVCKLQEMQQDLIQQHEEGHDEEDDEEDDEEYKAKDDEEDDSDESDDDEEDDADSDEEDDLVEDEDSQHLNF